MVKEVEVEGGPHAFLFGCALISIVYTLFSVVFFLVLLPSHSVRQVTGLWFEEKRINRELKQTQTQTSPAFFPFLCFITSQDNWYKQAMSSNACMYAINVD